MSKSNKVDVNKLDRWMKPDTEVQSGMQWLSPRNEPFRISGFPWLNQDGRYRRLPAAPNWPIPPAVDSLANCTAGGQIRFQTDSRKLAIRVQLSGPANMSHMPSTGQCGFDCYVEIDGDNRYGCTTVYDHTRTDYEVNLFDVDDKRMRSITLYFPLYQGVESVELGLETDAVLQAPVPYASDKKVIIYGTSITQGGCASRPGMAYPNIMSRSIPLEFINLGFSGNGRGEPELARILCEIENPGCYVLDYEANCVSPDKLRETLPEFIRILRASHPEVPIVVLSKIRFSRERLNPSLLQNRLINLQTQKETVERLRAQGDHNIHFYDGSTLLGDRYDECTVDGTHPTDLGFLLMADGLTPFIRQLLAELL
ncbi:SGNH/GDSL hydrolase family protein [Paenibacillus sp. J2TS4]|uniref:SGNH/GDSL hydrolase family protein n=1 Tax=Paenibacillus sp. J2TS4 TaxID=2807194 RepID=UPI001B1BA92F|nr:SGNH/GDSL hydrolase family protein [Paenibacillus sp. J2TS4]GIP34421.1 hydrolase [Paenibacillus sp. J2TS4]